MPVSDRALVLDGAYFTNLLGDDIVAKSFMTPIAQPGVVEGLIRRLAGFDVFETSILPENGEKLVGFAAHPSCLAVAMRYLMPVADYDEAIAFYVDVLGFELIEDSTAETNDGRPKRWVVVRPPGAQTALLLAQADGERQAAAVGDQFAGRVGLFLRVDDFDATFERMTEAGVEFFGEPRDEPYGRVVVFADVAGNRWDLLGPRP